MFISFEGAEASGKSTLMAAVDRALRNEGRATLLTREPGGTALGDALRCMFLTGGAIRPITEALLVNASRAELVENVIRPAIERGVAVLCDRYVHSTLAYQGYGRELPLQLVRAICDASTEGLMPDVTFVLDISYRVSRERLKTRGNDLDRIEESDRAFHERVRQGYLELSRRDDRIVLLDGERDAEDVANAALAALAALQS